MKAYYDNKPLILESVGNGSYYYRWNIEEFQINDMNETFRTNWKCDEVIIWSPLTANKITTKVINELWNNNYEQKLINDYNCAKLGIYNEEESNEKIENYKNFLKERNNVKIQIDNDCRDFGVI